jgi:prepilin-type N-terminal cleavage/methylation domain-containing protein
MLRRGFTLIELLISLAVLAIISVYLTNMLTQQNRAYAVVDQVTEVQSNARALLDLLEREVRATAMLAPEAAAVCGVDNTVNADVLYVTDEDAYDFDKETRYNLGATINAGFVGVGVLETLVLESIDVDDTPFYDTDADGTPDADFREGGGVIVVDRNNPERGAACGVIAPGGVDVAGKRINVDFSGTPATLGPKPFGSGPADLVAVPAHRYMVNVDNQLMRDDLILSEDVEDLQVSYFFDVDDDGIQDDPMDELPGRSNGDVYSNDDWDNTELREIRFNFVVRSRLPDPNLPGAVFQATENRAPIGVPDGYRRRVFNASVRPRNVGHRWGG